MASVITWMDLNEINKPSFVVNNAAASVAVTIPATPYLKTMGGALQAFQASDSIMILEYGLKLPECFELTQRAGDTLPNFTIGWARATDGANLTTLADALGSPLINAFVNLKGSNSEGLYLPHYSLLYPDPGVAGKLYWKVSPMNVSMLGVPDSLNGTTQYIEVFAKVQHQLGLL